MSGSCDDLRPWARMGGNGAFIYLDGQKQAGFTGMYVAEIPPHGALEPEKHLYEEMIYVLRGTGATEFWNVSDCATDPCV